MSATQSIVDLRSDTVTQPTPAMREAMMRAPLGDDVFGDDPSMNALQARVAALFDKEAALFMASGTQSNLCALLAHCQRGEEYIVGQHAHCFRYEGGGAAVLGGIQPQPVPNQSNGMLALADVAGAIKPDDAHFARTRLLCLENTWNGHALPQAEVAAACALAREHGLALHLDGARLFNAAASQGTTVRELAAAFDTVNISFCKGLGAPVGAMLVGSRALIAKAFRARKMLGGGMRQVGLLAAAASYALDHHLGRLADDHRRAQRLAEGLRALPQVQVSSLATNMVFATLSPPHQVSDLLAHLQQRGVLATGLLGLRFVTHLDVDDAGIDRALSAVRSFFVKD